MTELKDAVLHIPTVEPVDPAARRVPSLAELAFFIREHHYADFIENNVAVCRALNVPFMQFLEGKTEDEVYAIWGSALQDFMDCAAENRLHEYLDRAMAKWQADKMKVFNREDLTTDDISLYCYARKKSLQHFLGKYTQDLEDAITIVDEIDRFTMENLGRATNVYLGLLKERIDTQELFSEAIANTTPGLNYVFDVTTGGVKYVNKNCERFFGMSLKQMTELGAEIIGMLVHPDDVQVTLENLLKCTESAYGAVISWELRLRNSSGKYVWMRNYSAPFKRTAGGEIVGIALDVAVEKETANKLLDRERQLLEAQSRAQLGSFELDVETGAMEVTPQFEEIYGVQSPTLNDLLKNVHPDDIERINRNRNATIEEGSTYDNEYRYVLNGSEKILWTKGELTIKNGRKILKGTAMDVTSRHEMVERLLRSEELYKQAQEMAHIGSWTWNLDSNRYTWSDEMYQIYEIRKERIEGGFSPEETRKYRHPDDTEFVDEQIKLLVATGQPSDYSFRIVLPDGKIKYLHVKANLTHTQGQRVLFGTVQDVTEKQSLIEQLQQSEALFKEAQARTHIGNWTWDIAEDKVAWSDEMYRIYGLEPGTVAVNYETYLSHIHPEDRDERHRQVQEVFTTGIPEDRHYRIILPDGNIRILHTKSELEYNAKGQPKRMMGTCQDVTDKQLLIQELQQSEKRYKQAQAISHIGDWSRDIATNHTKWSEELYMIYELDPQTADINKVASLFNLPEDEEMIRAEIEKTIQTLEPFDFDYRIVLNNGKIKTLNAKGEAVTDASGKAAKLFGTVQDITDQKAIERQLKDSQEFIEKITDVTPSIIAAYNINTGQCSFINDAIEKLLGYSSTLVMEEGIGFISALVHPDDVKSLQEKNTLAIEAANSKGEEEGEPIAEFKYRLRHKNGTYRWVHTYGTVFERDNTGRVESILNVSVDITEQEIAEQALSQKNKELEQSNASLEEYAYVASHDLKEPLRKITTFSDRILYSQKDRLTDEGKMFLGKVIDSSRRMQTMINDLLAVSTIMGNKDYQATDLNELLAEALQPLEHKIEEKKATIEVKGLPVVHVVASQFRQLFQNLVGNSLKFAREGVSAHITISYTLKGEPHISERTGRLQARHLLEIEIKDNGIGFDNEYANKIFTIFQRLHGKSEYEGTGIGLAICKKIAENHNGTITAHGTPGEGATFTITIPM